ncbi:putative Acetylcholine receptor beta [Fasciola gigantica]|uniref:Putative Acetylcholine receptor beta n=1 Tax=Fasciola gigantica TaxID=46835 RepID=A0A504YYE0_FASGI|nr:putative Acetylcholine receptor beta [Fasciola gigantica]
MAFIRWALLLLAPFAPYIPLCEAGMAYLNLSVLPGSAHIQQSYWSLPLDPDGERFRQRMKAMSAAQTPPNEPSFFMEWTNPHTDLNTRDSDWSEKRLTKNLLRDYDCRSRPVIDHITPLIQVTPNLSVYQINVEFGLELLRILDLDEMDQVLTTSVRMLYLANSVGSILLVNTECLRNALNSTNSPTQDTEIADDVSYTHFTSPETKSSRVPKRHSPKFTKPNYSAQESESKQDENPYKRAQPINDYDTCWCLRAGTSPKITPNCFREQKVQTTLSSKACYSSVQSHLPDIARGEIKQIFKGSVGKENVHLSERTQEEEDCELCLRMQSNRGLLRPTSSVASSINSSAQNGLKHALQSLSPNCEQKFQPNTPNQGLRNLFATYDRETHGQSASVNSTENRFYIRLLGPNRVSRNSPIQTHELHWSEVSRGLLISDRIRPWQELEITSARHRFLNVEKDVQYITKTISRIESEKKERDCNARVAEQWRTICLALDRVFFLIYLITLIFSMCLFHPTVMSSLENMK